MILEVVPGQFLLGKTGRIFAGFPELWRVSPDEPDWAARTSLNTGASK